jgi:hypothetical protein
MSMTIGESNAVNTLLRWLFDLKEPFGHRVKEMDAKVAAVLLADSANRRLMAGLDGADVAHRWKVPLLPGTRGT